MLNIFLSSVQSEFATERVAIRDYVRGDKLLSKHFDVFIFEDAPAQDRTPQDLYLDELGRADIYVALFGAIYGRSDKEGVSATEREFDFAVKRGKERLIFVKEGSSAAREDRMRPLVDRAESQITRRSFDSLAALTAKLNESLLETLKRRKIISSLPLERRWSNLRTNELDRSLMESFVDRARETGRARFKARMKPIDALKSLDLIDAEGPTIAAALLFTSSPARVCAGARINCVAYSGVQARKPAVAQSVFEGDLFSQIEQAVEFVLARTNRAMPLRDISTSPEAPYELPPAAIREAVVNAVAHRDYVSDALVQVLLFSDRLEIRNPGELPPGLTPEALLGVHSSIPRNPLLIDILFRAEFMNRSGSGTTDMVEECRDAGLPEPEFFQDGDHWVVRFWRDWMNAEALARHGLSERQVAAMMSAKAQRRITVTRYVEIAGVSHATAKRDLEDLVNRKLLAARGAGRGAHYVFRSMGS